MHPEQPASICVSVCGKMHDCVIPEEIGSSVRGVVCGI
jgi:hypothetical protein